MKSTTFRKLRIGIAIFTAAIVSLSLIRDNIFLAVTGLVSGMVFMVFVRLKSDKKLDERENIVREKAAQLTFNIFTPALGLTAFFLFLFARGKWYFLEQIGITLAYLSFSLIAIYAISTLYLNRKYGGDDKE
jgi:uncharacterized membrane protein